MITIFHLSATVSGYACSVRKAFPQPPWASLHRSGKLLISPTIGALFAAVASPAAFAEVPAGWATHEIGSPAIAGGTNYQIGTDTWSVSGGGADVWGTADQFHFAARDFTADGTIAAKVTEIQSTGSFAKAGVMLRSGTSPDDGYAFVFVTPTNTTFECRNGKGATSYSVTANAGSTPRWVKLARSGGRLAGFSSSDGVNWQQLGTSQSLAIPVSGKIGLAVCANNNGALNASKFTNVSVATSTTSRVNLAKYQSASSDSASGGSTAALAVDGRARKESAWRSNSGSGGHWIIVELQALRQVGSVQLFLGNDDTGTIANFGLHYDDGTGMRPIPGTNFSGNTASVLNLTLANAVAAKRVMLYTSDSSAIVREIALYPPAVHEGWPVGTDVSVNVLEQRAVSTSSVDGGNFPKLSVDGHAGGSVAWRSGNTNGPHSLTVDLGAAVRIGSAHVYSGSNTVGAAVNFRIQYWNGSTWLDAPGGVVTGNTVKDRVVNFSSPVSTSRLLLLLSDNGQQTIREFAAFPGSTGIPGFPIGTGIDPHVAPTTKLTDLGEDWWRIQNRSSGGSLTATTEGSSEARSFTPELAKHYQVLYNVGSDSFRLRERVSGKCLEAQNPAFTPGSLVVLGDYTALPHQLWRIIARGDGYGQYVNVANGLALATNGSLPAAITLELPNSDWRQQWQLVFQSAFLRKGLADYGWDSEKAKVGWNYNWGHDPSGPLANGVAYSPMQWGPSGIGAVAERHGRWQADAKPMALMGFNEPDFGADAGGSNMSVASAIDLWPQVEASDLPLLAPAPAVMYGTWINDFFGQAASKGYRLDYTGVHWYGPPDASGLINYLQGIATNYGRPIWLTEFATTDFSGTADWSEEDNYRFLAEFLWMGEDCPWLKRYSIFPGYSTPAASPWERSEPHCHIFNPARQLTAVGDLYAGWDADRLVRPGSAYILHNKGSSFRLGNQSSGVRLDTIRAVDSGMQWMLVPATSGSVYLVSLADGRRLGCDGSQLSFATSAVSSGAVEWKVTQDSNGYYFIDHPATSKRLRLNRTNDGNGAPTGTWVSLENSGTVNDFVRWRLVKPAAPAALTSLPAGWTGADVGEPDLKGFGWFDRTLGTWTLGGSGHDIGSVSDQFYFASREFSGDGSMIVKVGEIQNPDPYSKAGIMFRSDADPDAPFAHVFAGPSTIGFETRTSAGALMQGIGYHAFSAPCWLKLTRTGNSFRGYHSNDRVSWSELGDGGAVVLPTTLKAGLAVTAHTNSAINSSKFIGFSLTPALWESTDVGSPVPGGAISDGTGGLWTFFAGGTDIWGTSDEFHFGRRALRGDGSVSTQVTATGDSDASSKTGVMIRESDAPGSPYAYVFVTPSNGIYFQDRLANGAVAASSAGVAGTAPRWVRIQRIGNLFRGYHSTDGSNWIQIGSAQTLSMEPAALVGLAASAHKVGIVNESSFSNLTMVSGFEYYRQQHFTSLQYATSSISGPLPDANGDGIANLLAYAQGLDPWSQATVGNGGRPQMGIEGGNLVINYTRLRGGGDVEYAIETSANLMTWSSDAVDVSEVAAVVIDATRERVSVRVNGGSSGTFARLAVRIAGGP